MSQSLLSTVSDSNKKFFSVGLHVLNELHVRCASLPQSDLRVVWFGGGLQGHLPVLFGMFPAVHFEIHTQRACPVSAELQSNLNVTYKKSSFEECLSEIEAYNGPQKFAVLLDMDFHIKQSELNVFNKTNIPVTVETESVHYDRYTKVYNAACARLARCGHVVLVSTPFRLPWITSDLAANGHKASWLTSDLGPHEVRVPNMLLFPQFGSRANSTELRGLMVVADGYSETVMDWQAYDKKMYGTPKEARQLEQAKFMLEQLERGKTVTTARRAQGVDGNACLFDWSDTFLRNSIGQLQQIVHDLECRNSGTIVYKRARSSAWSGAV
jgi:hypothetical protein